MAKRPNPGTTKTRLTPTLTAEEAAELYEMLLLDTLQFLQVRPDCTTVLAIDAPSSAEYFESIAPGVPQVLQVGLELGDRLDTVMSACLDMGFEAVFAIGSDSPHLPPAHLDQAFAALDEADTDIVLGPTEDGGYYLIGWKHQASRVVTDVEMSTPRVLDDTLAIAAELDLTVNLAPLWHDVDTPEDLPRLRASLAGRSDSFTSRFFDEQHAKDPVWLRES